MAETPKKPQQPTPRAPMTRRARSRHQREVQRQRLVITTAGVAIGLALLAVLVGVLYDRLWIPSRPLAQVGNITLTRSGYWQERRNDIARRLAQNLQLLTMFGGQFSSQFQGQIPQLDNQIPGIQTAPVDEETVNGWIDRQIIIQNATKQYNIQASDGEIAQRLVGDLGRVFAPPPPPPTNTTTLSPTTTLSATASLPTTGTAGPATTAGITGTTTASQATAVVTGTASTPTPGGPTATPAPTATPGPTAPPTATMAPEAALLEQDAVIGRLFDSYINELQRIDPQSRAQLTIDDFKAALRDEYLRQAVTSKVQEQLLPEASFTPTTDPSSITIRHILIQVTVPVTATQDEREAVYAARKPQAEAILKQIRDGADFATLAQQTSDDFATRDNGGELPSFDKEGKTQEGTQIDPAIVQAALALEENQVGDLVRTPFGWHIIQLTRRTVDSKADQLAAARTKAFDKWVADQRAATEIQRFPPTTSSPTAAATETPAPLPTAVLGASPTPTAVPTDTTTLTGTVTLTSTTTLPGTPASTTTPTVNPLSTTPTLPLGTAAPTALLPTPTGTPRP